MRRTSVTEVLGWAGLAILAAMAVSLLTSPVVAADSAAAPAAAAADTTDAATAPAAAAEKKSGKKTKGQQRARPRGRLPAYFGAVVTPELREKIYAVQAEYEPKISQLRKELDALTKARDEKIDALLTPEQKKKIEDLKAAARPSREKKESETKKETKKQTKKTKE